MNLLELPKIPANLSHERCHVNIIKLDSPRFVSSIISAMISESLKTEMDSHADSPVLGDNVEIIKLMDKEVTVSGFSDKLGNISKIPVVQAVVAYDFVITNKTYLLHINNTLYVKGMKSNLIPPFMMRLNGIEVNECPKFLSSNPSEKGHTIYIYIPDGQLHIHLFLDGTISFFNTRKPTKDELMYMDEYFDLTPPSEDWNPFDESFSSQEEAMMDDSCDIRPTKK